MRRRILLILLAVFTVPLGAQTPALLQVPYQQFKLANGLNVILHRDTSVPVVAVNMWYYVGSAGAARFTSPNHFSTSVFVFAVSMSPATTRLALVGA